MDFHLMRPEWLWSLLPAALLGLLLWRQRERRGSWSAVIAPELLEHLVSGPSAARSFNFLPLLFTGWVVAAIAASGPSWEKIPQPVHQKQDALVILLDLSFSMKAADLPPSRIDRARQKVFDILADRREGQTALVAFAGDAHIVTPLTDDTPTISNLLPALHPDMMPVPGSDPVAAIVQAIELLRSAGIRGGKLLLITDSITDEDVANARSLVLEAGVDIAVMGVGTPTGAPIPLARGGFIKDPGGAIVMPGLRTDTMQALADQSGGRFTTMSINDSDWNYLLAPIPGVDSQQTLALERGADTWDDKGYWLALLLLPLALGLFRRGWLLCLVPLMIILPADPASADGWNDLWLSPDQQAQRALQQGDNARASELFERNDWAGTAAYRAQDYARAAEQFARGDSANDWYNRGNALAREGKLEEAAEAYRQSLQREPDAADAQANLELVEQLRKQQQEQEQQNQQSGEQSSDAQNSDTDDNSQQQDQQAGQQSSQQSSQQEQQDPSSGESEEQQDGAQQSPPSANEQDSAAQQQAEQPEPDAAEQQEELEDSAAGKERDASAAAQEDKNGAALPGEQEQSEVDQATQQWLRRIPDDPSGLLRQKFRYESEQRKHESDRRTNETYW